MSPADQQRGQRAIAAIRDARRQAAEREADFRAEAIEARYESRAR